MANTQTRKRAPRADEDPIAAEGASDDALDEAEVSEAEPIAEPVDGGEAEHDIEFGASTMVGSDELDDLVDDEDEEDLAPPVQTRVRLRVNGRVKVVPLVHQPGCPARAVRVESYPLQSPRGRRFIVTRCVDCGEQKRTRVKSARRD